MPAARPTISAAPTAVGYAASFQVQSPNATDIGSVVLVRPGSPTHAFDMEQRMVGLSFSVAGNTGVKKKTFYYRVRAYNASGDSGYSNTVFVQVP